MKTKPKQIMARFTVGQEVLLISRTYGEVTVTVVGVLQDRDGTCYDIALPSGGTRTVGERFLSAA